MTAVLVTAFKLADRCSGRTLSRWRRARKPDVVQMCDQLAAMPEEPTQKSFLSELAVKPIRVYQKLYSDSRNVCSFGTERNCSRLGVRATRHFGPLKGLRMVGLILFVSPHLNENGCEFKDFCDPSD